MPAPLEHLTHLDQVEELVRESATRPVLIFKHSTSCGTSAQAMDELLEHLDHADAADARYAVVTVQSHRAISNGIAQRFAVRHETPQALLIVDGRVTWAASHFRVTAKAMAATIRDAASRVPQGS
jgi:bacillithiol system protein YtxJ